MRGHGVTASAGVLIRTWEVRPLARSRCAADASREVVERWPWRREYNESRPHRALGERTPYGIACEFAASREFTSTTTAGDSLSG
jgi:hypothetical protein